MTALDGPVGPPPTSPLTGSISIVNPSFEDVTVNANTAACTANGRLRSNYFIDNFSNYGFSNGCVDPTPAPGWTFTGQNSGVQAAVDDLLGKTGPNSLVISPPLSGQSGVVSQLLDEPLRVGTYTLKVDIGSRAANPLQSYSIALTAGSTIIGSSTKRCQPRTGLVCDRHTSCVHSLRSPPLRPALGHSVYRRPATSRNAGQL